MKFVITGLPRTRSAWLSAFFNVPHEGIRKGYSLRFMGGTCDCGYAIQPTWVEQQVPHKLVIIERPMLEVAESLRAINYPTSGLPHLAEALSGFYKEAFVVSYPELDQRLEEICQFIEEDYDDNRHRRLRDLHIVGREYRVIS